MSRYAKAINWIAENDEPGELNYKVVADLISTLLVAELFNRDAEDVAGDIVRVRHCKRLGTTDQLPKRLVAQA